MEESTKPPTDVQPKSGPISGYCVLCGARRKDYPSRKYHTFPSNPVLSNKWACITGKKWVIAAPPAVRHKRYRICSEHFSSEQYTDLTKHRLQPSAIPTPLTVVKNQSSIMLDLSSLQSSIKKKLSSTSISAPFEDVSGESSMVKVVENESSTVGSFLCSTPKRKRKSPVVTPKTKRIRTLSSKLHYLQRKYDKSAVTMHVTQILNSIKGLVTPVIYNFIASQLKSSCVSKYGRRWSVNDKNLALQLYLASPKAYNSLYKFFNFPSKRTLQKCLSGVEMAPGFSDAVLGAIKLVASKLKVYDKYCVISFDEMKLKSGLSYNAKCDMIEGYENYGSYHIENSRLATHALVFMVRRLCKKWKQVFGYFFAHECTSSVVLKHLINEGISKLFECGLEPVAIVCDQGANNQRLYAKELGISVEKPFFFVQDHKIYSLFDTPHLLKCVRNNFKRYPVQFLNNGLIKVAYWSHIASMWELDSQLTHRMAPKLTRRHIEVDGLSTMNVRLAAQVFSSSVASALCYLGTFNVLPSTAINTADFCSSLNDLFESVNGRSLKNSDRPLLAAVSKTSPHLESWQKFSEFMQSVQFQTEGKRISFPCLQGWLITLSAFRRMVPELLVNIPYILMSRFTHDALENFFSVVRRRGGNNDHPTPSDFNCRMRALMAQNIINTCGNANCESDNDTVLVPVEVFTKSSFRKVVSLCENLDDEASFLKFDEDSPNELQGEILSDEQLHCENSASYVAGFIAKQALKKFHCKECEGSLLGEKTLSSSSIFLYFKEYDNVKEGLHAPSKPWLATIYEFGRRFPVLYNEFCKKCNVKCNIVNNLYNLNHSWICCYQHNQQIWEFILNFYVKMMLFYKVKCVSTNLRSSKRVSKKLKKMS